MPISIQFLGGAQTVTGSMHLISVNGSKILIDCGLYHGRRDEAFEVNSNFNFNPKEINAVILSHAHVDHCGNLPTLVNKGFRSNIYSTIPTQKLCDYMLPDSGHVQEEDVKYVNKINLKRDLPPRMPLYTVNDAINTLPYFMPVEYHRRQRITDNIDVTFFDAGHILGSSIPVLDIKTGDKNTRIAYAVDLGRPKMPLIRDPEIPKDVDYLIIESTYGARTHDTIEAAEDELASAINSTVARGGKIIIPSFALERAQLLVYFISELIKRGKVKKLPIYVDSPLTVNLTNVFRQNWEYFDEITKEAFKREEDPLGYDNITYISDVNDSKRLSFEDGPMIIISASGMCENGRILHHLKNNIGSPKNTVIIAGFMAKNTLGRRIVEREKTVKIFGQPVDLKAEVVTLNAFSSHADKNGLLDFVKGCGHKVKKVFIVHGEIEQSKIFEESLKEQGINASIPAKNETVTL
ncbi:MAG: MBL fold metallo-hydrolase [Elusimicrobiota bacterium]